MSTDWPERLAGPIEVVLCHAAGEVGDVVVGGVPVPPGETLWEQSRWVARDGGLRGVLLHEPRGGVFKHVNLLVPPVDPQAQVGFIIMEPVHTPPMSGSNTMCVATVVLETGIVEMREPVTELVLEAPGGVVPVRARCREGKVEAVTVRNLPSFVARRDVMIEVAGIGTVRVDTAYGGDSFVMVEAEDLGFAIEPDEAADLVRVGSAVTAAASEQIGFAHPDQPGWNHISFCQIARRLPDRDGQVVMRNTVVIEPGKLDRSPTGTGVSARLALLHGQGEIALGGRLIMESITGGEFVGEVVGEAALSDGTPAVIPEVTGTAYRYGTASYVVDPTDPWPQGYRVGDTWP